jgi:hypothetical protein
VFTFGVRHHNYAAVESDAAHEYYVTCQNNIKCCDIKFYFKKYIETWLLSCLPKFWVNNLMVSSWALLCRWRSVITFILIFNIFIATTPCFFPSATTIIMHLQCNNVIFSRLQQQKQRQGTHLWSFSLLSSSSKTFLNFGHLIFLKFFYFFVTSYQDCVFSFNKFVYLITWMIIKIDQLMNSKGNGPITTLITWM